MGRPYTAKRFCVSSLDKSGTFAALLIQVHVLRVLVHLGTDSEIIQNPNVATASIHVLTGPYDNTNYDQSTDRKQCKCKQ